MEIMVANTTTKCNSEISKRNKNMGFETGCVFTPGGLSVESEKMMKMIEAIT